MAKQYTFFNDYENNHGHNDDTIKVIIVIIVIITVIIIVFFLSYVPPTEIISCIIDIMAIIAQLWGWHFLKYFHT